MYFFIRSKLSDQNDKFSTTRKIVLGSLWVSLIFLHTVVIWIFVHCWYHSHIVQCHYENLRIWNINSFALFWLRYCRRQLSMSKNIRALFDTFRFYQVNNSKFFMSSQNNIPLWHRIPVKNLIISLLRKFMQKELKHQD